MGNNKKNLYKIRRELRRTIIDASYRSHACHIASALSCVDIIWDIYNKMEWGDIFIFSKASGVAALYAVLAKKGYFPEDKVAYYLKNYALGNKEVPGVFLNSGSLGHGLPMACGVALVLKNLGKSAYVDGKTKGFKPNKVYCLMSDGEMQEGTTWESLLFKKQHNLDNLLIYCDYNGFQACGKIKDILDVPVEFLKEYGVKIIKTIKGKGVDFMENKNEWHYFNLDENTYKEAIRQLAD